MIREGENNRVTECLGAFFLKARSQEGGKRSKQQPKPITQSGWGQADQTTTKTNQSLSAPPQVPGPHVSDKNSVQFSGPGTCGGALQGLVGVGLRMVACPLPDLFFLTSADNFLSHRAIILGTREPEPLHIPLQLPNRLVE